MRDFTQFEKHLDALTADIYGQPPDEGHTQWAVDVVSKLATIPVGITSVLDVGCGRGFLKPVFETYLGWTWAGVTLGEDFVIGKEAGVGNLHHADMTFLPFPDNDFDMVFARHVLEHSPFPLITLMEWRRVAKSWLLLVLPAPDYWLFRGKNHYSVMVKEQIEWLLARSGWRPIHESKMTTHDDLFLDYVQGNWLEEAEKPDEHPPKDVEWHFLCEKVDPRLE